MESSLIAMSELCNAGCEVDNYEPPEIRNHLDNNLNIHDDKPTVPISVSYNIF